MSVGEKFTEDEIFGLKVRLNQQTGIREVFCIFKHQILQSNENHSTDRAADHFVPE